VLKMSGAMKNEDARRRGSAAGCACARQRLLSAPACAVDTFQMQHIV
jgi:hypothetical protein